MSRTPADEIEPSVRSAAAVTRAVLVAEDSATQAERVRLLLEGAGYRVQVVPDGGAGLEALRRAAPDLIVSDVLMPGLDGYQFCRAVKSAPATRHIPFVLLTEHRTPADIILGLEQGADNFITKPFEDDYLLERIGRIFEHLERRKTGRFEIEVTIRVAGQELVLNADRQQIIELLFATSEELAGANLQLAESKRLITAQRRTEEKLRLQGAALEASADAVVITDRDGAITWVNRAFTRLTGYTLEECRGQTPRLLRSGQHQPEFYTRLWQTILSGEVWRGEMSNRRKDGSLYLEEQTITPVADESGRITHFIGIKVDVTERKQLEEQLRRVQKLQAVGQLAGGIAHDFNNFLSVIAGYCDLLLRHSSLESREQIKIEEIRKAGERAAVLTRQLLTFSRQQIAEPEVLDVNAVLSGMEGMLRRLIREDIQLLTVFGSGLHPVRADRGQIEQVVVNLVVNARDAMPAGGRLVIETGEVLLDEEYCRTHLGAEPGLHLMLVVTDSGTGMDAETQSRIFEPFFTTKQEGKGTGLGLATVYGIVKQWSGSVFVYSEVGRGTTFKVYFPAVRGKAEAQRPSVSAGEPPRGRETVLLAEDDDTLRDLTGEILQDLGYTVLSARDGLAALEVCKKHDGPVHLLLTDLIMPRMSGRELAERLRASRPETAVLFMSGYTDDAVVRDGMLEAAVAFLQKPFTPEALARKVRGVVDGQ